MGAETLAQRMAGRILLEVEKNGEAWYVSPDNLMRHYLGRPEDAFALMRGRGVGITNADLARIPVGFCDDAVKCGPAGADTDGDGLPDLLEDALGTDKTKADSDGDGHSDKEELATGYDPLGPGVLPVDTVFAARQKGKIFLQVEARGEAWYVYPADNKRYFLGRPRDAFNLMRALGLGITTDDLAKILTLTPNYDLGRLERLIFDGVNRERIGQGLPALLWNDELAAVAREHSRDLAAENGKLTDMEMSCDFPIIHHEGLVFGADNSERLRNRGVYYFSQAGENIALMPGVARKLITAAGADGAAGIEGELDRCQKLEKSMDQAFKEALAAAADTEEKSALVREELAAREAEFARGERIAIVEIGWKDEGKLAADIEDGWMASPGHRDNILTGSYDEAGMGIAYVNGYVIATQVFIRRADCGFKNGPCCEKKGYYPYCFIPLECVDERVCE